MLDFANSVLSGVAFQPDLLYTIDVAEIADGMASRLKIIELNSFSASGWYTYNVPELVKRTREIVIQDYLDIYGE